MRGEEPIDAKKSKNYVKGVPEKFDNWIDKNKERAKGWSTMPYFIRQNPQYVKGFEVDTYSQEEKEFTRVRRTNKAMKESLDIFLKSKYPEIPNTEKAAIYYYTQGDRPAFRQLNKQLRKGGLTEFNQAFSELLSSALNKLPVYEGTVYRTLRLNRTQLNDFINLAENNKETVFDGFTSTSKELTIVEDIIKKKSKIKNNETDVILVIEGKSGHDIEDFSQYGWRYKGYQNQREVLFDKGMNARFDKYKISNDRVIFYMIEL